MKDSEYIFADLYDIRFNTYSDFCIESNVYRFIYVKGPFKIEATVKKNDWLNIDSDAIIRLIAKKYDELMLNEYVTVTSIDTRKDEIE